MGADDRSADPPRAPEASWIPAALVLVIMIAIGLFVIESYEPPTVVPAGAPAEIFSAERAFQRLERLLGEETPHPLGSVANEAVRKRLLTELEDLGLDPEENDHWVSTANRWSTGLVLARNIMAELPSSNPDLPAIVLACHYDSVPSGPGASDDGAAVAALLEVAQILMADAPLARPVILLFTDGEELGLHGARAFSTFNPAAARVGIIVNFEARGSSGGSLLFETSQNNLWMVGQVARGLRRPMSSSAYVTVYRMMPNSSDLTVFMRHELAGMNFAYIGRPKHYHTPLDNLENLDQRSLQHHGDNALGMVRQLLTTEWTAAKADDDAVYTDLVARWIIAWPAKWGPWMAGILVVLLYLPFRKLRVRSAWNSLQIARATSCWILSNLIGTTAGWLGAWVVQQLDHTPTPWPAALHLDVIVPCLCAAMGVILTVLFLRPRPALFFFIHGLALAVVALVLAIQLPGFSYLFLLPAGGATLASLFLILDRKAGTVALTVACLIVAAITLTLTVPFLFRLPESLGIIYSPPALAGLIVLILLPIVPLLSQLSRPLLLRSFMALGLAASVVAYFAIRTPPFTPDAPQQITLTYLEQEGSAQAQLSMSTWEGELPAALTEELPRLEPPNALYSVPGITLATEKAGLAAPEVELLDWNAEGSLHTAKLRFTRSQPSQQILVGVTVLQGLRKIHALGNELALPEGSADGRKWIRFRGVPEDGIEIELTWEGPGTLPLAVIGITRGLPSSLESLAGKRDDLPACTAHVGDETIVLKEVVLASPVF